MDNATRRELAGEALRGYPSGPGASTRATAQALAKATAASVVVLVEGISDQIVLETLASRRGQNLDAERVVILPMGGAHAVTRYLRQFGPQGADVRLAGLCDAAEEGVFQRGLVQAGIARPHTREEMRRLGFHVCVEDLEDELIRAVGVEAFLELVDSQGELGSFRTMQRQPAWRDKDVDAQVRRFLRSVARRYLIYLGLLVQALDLDRLPEPLEAILTDL